MSPNNNFAFLNMISGLVSSNNQSMQTHVE